MTAINFADVQFGWGPNAAIRAFQQALTDHGFNAGGDGVFKTQTRTACTGFQVAQGWSGSGADGLPGPLTFARLGLTNVGQPVASGPLGADVLKYAFNNFFQLPYTWGNNDCSGIMHKTFVNGFGIPMGGVSSTQWSYGRPLTLPTDLTLASSVLVAGDLLFYQPGANGAPPGLPGHVAMWAGADMCFAAQSTAHPIGFFPAFQPGYLTFMGARRIVGA